MDSIFTAYARARPIHSSACRHCCCCSSGEKQKRSSLSIAREKEREKTINSPRSRGMASATVCSHVFSFFCRAGLLVLDDDDIVDEQQQQQQQQYQTSSRGSSSMGRLNGRQMGHPTGTTLVAQSSTGGTHHRTGMMMAQQQQQHVPHYQLPPTPPQHHPVHHLGYVHPHLHHVANNSTKDVCDEMDSDPTTLLKHTPSSSQKFIPQGNQNLILLLLLPIPLCCFCCCC